MSYTKGKNMIIDGNIFFGGFQKEEFIKETNEIITQYAKYENMKIIFLRGVVDAVAETIEESGIVQKFHMDEMFQAMLPVIIFHDFNGVVFVSEDGGYKVVIETLRSEREINYSVTICGEHNGKPGCFSIGKGWEEVEDVPVEDNESYTSSMKAAVMLEYYGIYDKNDEKEWEKFYSENKETIGFIEGMKSVLDFTIRGENVYAVPVDAGCFGTAIRLKNGKYEIFQFLPEYEILMRTMPILMIKDIPVIITDRGEDCFIVKIGETENSRDVRRFVEYHMDRSSERCVVFSIPVSMDVVMHLDDAFLFDTENAVRNWVLDNCPDDMDYLMKKTNKAMEYIKGIAEKIPKEK